MKINIAIDGPSSSGKSSVSKELAKRLGYVHLDTGAMYRSTAYKARMNHIPLDHEQEICDMLKSTEIILTPDGSVFLDGVDVSMEIRTDENSLAASQVSQLKQVRADLVKRQQEMAKNKGFIMDGRDICTVVLPDAEVKVFLTASARARAERRYKQNIEKGIPTSDIDTIEKEIALRDYQDMNRKESPLKQADDAVLIDTSDMDFQDVVAKINALVQPFISQGDVE